MKHTYSPHPIEAYFTPGADMCEFRMIAKSPWSIEIWNLMWLSIPSVDSMPGSSATGYWRNYMSDPTLIGAIVADATHDEKLREMLAQPPAIFHGWFCAERDYTIYDAWDAAGPAWVETVADRSDEAATRRLGQQPMIFAEAATLRIDLRKVA